MPEVRIGQGYRLTAPGIPGTGEVVHVVPANEEMSQEAIMRYYGCNPQASPEKYLGFQRAHSCERIVIERDDRPTFVIVPPQLLPTMSQPLYSPECPTCHRLSPYQKWFTEPTEPKCPKCGAPHVPPDPAVTLE